MEEEGKEGKEEEGGGGRGKGEGKEDDGVLEAQDLHQSKLGELICKLEDTAGED